MDSIDFVQLAPYLFFVGGALFQVFVPFFMLREPGEAIDWKNHVVPKVASFLMALVPFIVEHPEIEQMDWRAAIQLGITAFAGSAAAAVGRLAYKVA